MRKVKFNKWIPAIYAREEGVIKYIREGTNCWERDFPNDGVFHQWLYIFNEQVSGTESYIITLVELPDGTIAEVLQSNIKFIEPMI
jgi:hypothetical protein